MWRVQVPRAHSIPVSCGHNCLGLSERCLDGLLQNALALEEIEDRIPRAQSRGVAERRAQSVGIEPEPPGPAWNPGDIQRNLHVIEAGHRRRNSPSHFLPLSL